MKQIIITIIALIISLNSFSQLNDGKYIFKNKEMKLIIKISDNGWDLNVTMINIKTKKVIKSIGVWFKIPRLNVDPNYKGPGGWYKFETPNFYYEFDKPKNILILYQFDIRQNKERKFILTK
jgi:hypothetical protein